MTRPEDEGWQPDVHGGFIAGFATLWRRQEPGGLAFAMRVEQRHLDRAGTMSSGALMVFADHAVGHAAMPVFGVAQVTIQLQVAPVLAVAPGDFLEGRGELIGHDGDIAHLRGRFCVGNRVVASADGRWKRVRPLS